MEREKPSTTSTILVVEDDSTLRELLAYNLRKEGYEVLEAADGARALEVYRSRTPALVILDIMLPVMTGLEVCRIMRAEKNVPIIMLTAKAEEIDRVVGLELGADDYMTKPFSMRELQARIRAVLRRSSGGEPREGADAGDSARIMQGGDIRLDMSKHTVSSGNEPVELNPKEFELLALLMSNPGHVMSREQALRKVWGYDYLGNLRTVDVHIRWLRQKLEKDADRPYHILTVRGYGYKFEA